MKRILSLLLALILMISVLVGCSGEDKEVVESEPEVKQEEVIKKETEEEKTKREEREKLARRSKELAEQAIKEMDKEEAIEDESDRKEEIEIIIKSRIDDGDYENANLERIVINENLGEGEEGTYIALVYFDFDIKNKRETGNSIMKMYSNDLAATLANKGVEDITEIAIFWEDDYNNRDVKYAYEYKDGQFYITDIAGE